MRDEDSKLVFSRFYFYFNDNDPNDQFNSKEKKFHNLHANKKINTMKQSQSENTSSRQKLILEKANIYSSNERKFSKVKLSSASNSNSSSSIVRHYRQVSSNNSTSNSTNISNSNPQPANQLKGKRTNSMLNFKY